MTVWCMQFEEVRFSEKLRRESLNGYKVQDVEMKKENDFYGSVIKGEILWHV